MTDKVTITPLETFNLKINDYSLGEFKFESKWEGMVKLSHTGGKGIIIVSDNTSFIDSMFKDYFGDKTIDKDFVIISISPDLIPNNFGSK